VTNDLNDRPQILLSNLTEKRQIHFLKIKLVGTKSNRDGLGAHELSYVVAGFKLNWRVTTPFPLVPTDARYRNRSTNS
jgi:hypothetical protein